MNDSEFKRPALTDTILMVRPDQFGFNPQTALTNFFQNKKDTASRQIRQMAINEFNGTVNTLLKEGINVYTLPSPKKMVTPDAVFPNNWFSSHTSGNLIIYPLLTKNRRLERQTNNLLKLFKKIGIKNPKLIDLSPNEKKGKILEGTGSLVLDRTNKVAFAMQSSRTNKKMFDEWCSLTGYEGLFFHAFDKNKLPVYHTNVIMSIGDGFCVFCPQSISDPIERKKFRTKLKECGKEPIEITLGQVYSFCGNILNLKSKNGERKIIMSKRAYDNFTEKQKKTLSRYGKLVKVNIPTIETIGGGSARCMMAEIFR